MTLEDIRGSVGASVARDVASRLVAKRALERIGRGRYLVRPLRTQSRPWEEEGLLEKDAPDLVVPGRGCLPAVLLDASAHLHQSARAVGNAEGIPGEAQGKQRRMREEATADDEVGRAVELEEEELSWIEGLELPVDTIWKCPCGGSLRWTQMLTKRERVVDVDDLDDAEVDFVKGDAPLDAALVMNADGLTAQHRPETEKTL